MSRTVSILGFGIFIGLFMSHLLWGSVHIPWCQGLSEVHETILWEVRLPRVLTAIGTGAALSVCGLLLQTWFGNPLAGPSVLGVSSGAGMGVALMVLAGIGAGWWLVSAAAIVGASASLSLVLFVAHRFRTAASLLIFGLMLNYVLGALITVLQSEAEQEALQQFVFWGMGSFGQGTPETAVLLLGMAGIGWATAQSMGRTLDAWTLGEWTACSMGVNPNRLKWKVVALAGSMTGIITALCGPVAFLGLATPHVVRLFTAERRHGILIPMTAMTGAILAMAADWGVKGLWGMESGWPLNAVLSLIGGPMVVWVLVSGSKTST